MSALIKTKTGLPKMDMFRQRFCLSLEQKWAYQAKKTIRKTRGIPHPASDWFRRLKILRLIFASSLLGSQEAQFRLFAVDRLDK